MRRTSAHGFSMKQAEPHDRNGVRPRCDGRAGQPCCNYPAHWSIHDVPESNSAPRHFGGLRSRASEGGESGSCSGAAHGVCARVSVPQRTVGQKQFAALLALLVFLVLSVPGWR
jgi:hypothetical protein